MKRRRPTNNRHARSATRLAVVQGLYQMDLAATDLNVVIRDLTSHPIDESAGEEEQGAAESEDQTSRSDPIDPTFLAEMLRGVVRLQREIDPMIDNQLATGWRLARVDSILRAILRAGVYELMDRPDAPARVVINEYIDVAHAFLAAEDTRVVNGVLDKLARRIRPAEFEAA
ncbi:MAG: transcription antitermination factor NusB [Hyphomicrobiaceae bacterium]